MRCPNCGCEIQPGGQYCSYCGLVLPVPNQYQASAGDPVRPTQTIRRSGRRARRAKRSLINHQDMVILLLFLILLLQVIQLLFMIG